MKRFTIDVSDSTFDTLGRLARQERRPLRDQAAVVLEQVLGVTPRDDQPFPQILRLPHMPLGVAS